MIEVKNLTKRYGGHVAVSNLSFRIESGQIYGFLGPNGAGKSTTMNIITGCLGATEGDVTVDGHSVLDDPIEAKKCIGYLPELPPLYMDMTPLEYLRLVLKMKGVKKSEWDAQLNSVMDRTKIDDVKDRLIGNLSKGYRQRVGIAQALLGNPKVIILDEPTVGLDPAQIIEIRELIKSLGKDHTVILSSHILSEVQAVCDQIMIIAHGKLVASDTAENLTSLMASGSRIAMIVRASIDEIEAVLVKMDGIESAGYKALDEGETAVQILPRDGADIREALFFAFADAGLPILEMRRERATLEDVFLELTQSDPSAEQAQEVNKA